ncbi:hypothetical protein AB0L53_48790 [Nonomuraea sp. NPDC052129]|uniref:hypothetical protein n=1 Tax=Nonomuraea sp. NPDC052129 TaxID=3154651 RepID=UPI00344915BB
MGTSDVSPRAARLGDRLDAARNAAFTGRATHLAAFRGALTGGPAAVLFIHGPGAVGKSSLLRRYADEARRADLAAAGGRAARGDRGRPGRGRRVAARAPAVRHAGASTSASPASCWTRLGTSSLPRSWTS